MFNVMTSSQQLHYMIIELTRLELQRVREKNAQDDCECSSLNRLVENRHKCIYTSNIEIVKMHYLAVARR